MYTHTLSLHRTHYLPPFPTPPPPSKCFFLPLINNLSFLLKSHMCASYTDGNGAIVSARTTKNKVTIPPTLPPRAFRCLLRTHIFPNFFRGKRVPIHSIVRARSISLFLSSTLPLFLSHTQTHTLSLTLSLSSPTLSPPPTSQPLSKFMSKHAPVFSRFGCYFETHSLAHNSCCFTRSNFLCTINEKLYIFFFFCMYAALYLHEALSAFGSCSKDI